MSFVVSLLVAFIVAPFQTSIDRAFSDIQKNDWTDAAAALDQALAEDAATFAANNLHYLRGRVAEQHNDWARARDEFSKVGMGNPLRALASWHAAQASLRLHDNAAAETFIQSLPSGFPQELRMQLAREASPEFSQKIYQDLNTREARYKLASALGKNDTLWSLIGESQDDDVALASARVLAPLAMSAHDQVQLAEIFAGHRVFDEALPLYAKAAADPMTAAAARYQVARIRFQQEKYQLALDNYRAIARDFEGTDWEKDSAYEIASCYWRLNDFPNAEKAYLEYIRKYGRSGMFEGATRNLVDVYRVLGENQKALATIDKALAGQLSVATRQVFLFTKAKILYTQKRYTAALALFQQLGRTKLRSAPGSATAEEVEYFQALCQSKLGNKLAANVIWNKLARNQSFYGLRSSEHLRQAASSATPAACASPQPPAARTAELDIAPLRHALRSAPDSSTDAVSELLFLRLWDEAAFWLDRSDSSIPRRAAAEISYLGGKYDRAISLADRLPRSEATLPLVYPAGYRKTICDAAKTFGTDALWLHAIIWQESKYNPTSRSGAAARGLMQFIPETASAVASTIGMSNLTLEKLFDPSTSIQLGAAYWASLMERFKSPELALAAYNGGPDNVQRWFDKSSDPELFVSDIGFVETKKYVMFVYAAHAAYMSLLN